MGWMVGARRFRTRPFESAPNQSLRRLRAGVATWGEAVTSGAFYTQPTAVVSLLACLTVLAPLESHRVPGDTHDVLLVAFTTWLIQLVAFIPVAAMERQLTTRGARAVVVLGALSVGAATRPYLNEAFWAFLHRTEMGEVDPVRVFSTVVIAFALCSVVAMTTRALRLGEVRRGRLDAALQALADGRGKLSRFERDNRDRIEGLVATLREQRDGLLAGHIDFSAVRTYSDHVRRISHHLEDRAQLNLRLVVPDEHTGECPAPREHTPRLARVTPPPYGVVGVVFLLCALPYLCGLPSLPAVGGALLVAAPIMLAADYVGHRLALRLTRQGTGLALILIWFVAGGLITAAGYTMLDGADPLLALPLLSVPAVAVACAVCTDAVQAARLSAVHLESVLGLVATSLTHETSRARRPLRHAAHVLHGRVQGRCVILAAAADEGLLTEQGLEAFRHDTDDAFAAILGALDGDPVAVSHEDLSELLDTWSSVLEIESDIDPRVGPVLAEADVSRRVAAVVNEGFVNAVKHSGVSRVGLAIDAEAGPGLVRVRTWSVGTLDVTSAERGLSVDVLGDHARIFQRGDEVVLEVHLQVHPDVGSTSPVTVVTGRRLVPAFLTPRAGG